MELLSLIPMLLKIAPFVGLGVLYILWRAAAYKRDQAKAEAEAAKSSYELAEEARKIEKERSEINEAIDKLPLSDLIDLFRTGRVRKSPDS